MLNRKERFSDAYLCVFFVLSGLNAAKNESATKSLDTSLLWGYNSFS